MVSGNKFFFFLKKEKKKLTWFVDSKIDTVGRWRVSSVGQNDCATHSIPVDR